MSAQVYKMFQLGFCFLLFLSFSGVADLEIVEGNSAVEVYYSVNNVQDGLYINTQLAKEYLNGDVNLDLTLLPYSEVQIISDQSGTFYCHGAENVCQTSLVHYCSEMASTEMKQFLTFLQCYFQSEHFPVDLMNASKQCHSELDWEVVIACVANSESFTDFANDVRVTQDLRPITELSLRVSLNGQFSHLAAIDLKKALCRINATNIWDCESSIQYKVPSLHLFYTLQAALDFDTLQKMLDTTSSIHVLPNPNILSKCVPINTEECIEYFLHWCIYKHFTADKQIEKLKCLYKPENGQKQQECLSENDVNITSQCISQIKTSGLPTLLVDFQEKLNKEVNVSEQQSIEVLINDLSNVKAQNGLLEEVCYNYLHVDNETLGCSSSRPTVQIFYEPIENLFVSKFAHFIPLAKLAPFESIADFEFNPYPTNATYNNGTYGCPEDNGQCMATWIHGCILKMHYTLPQDQFDFLRFFICTSGKEGLDPMQQAEQCVAEVYDFGDQFWPSLNYCAVNDNNIKQELHDKIELIELNDMPEIVINEKVKTKEAGERLLQYLCEESTPIKSRDCFEIEDLKRIVRVTVFLDADDDTQSARKFMLSQVKPLLEIGRSTRTPDLYLRDMIEWSFVPWGSSTFNASDASEDVKCASSTNNLTSSSNCLLNSIFTCASRVHSTRDTYRLGMREDRLRVVSFIVCFYESPIWQSSPLKAAEECTGKLSSQETVFSQLEQCATQSSTKTFFLLQMKQLTENNYPKLTVFPVVSVDQTAPKVIENLSDHLCSVFNDVNKSLIPLECIQEEETTTELQNYTTTETPNGKAKKPNAMFVFSFVLLLTICYNYLCNSM